MANVNRYKVTGSAANGTPITHCYSNKANAMRLANEIRDSAVYDLETKHYVGGNSDFAKRMVAAAKEQA
jgi:hypothetical protein